MSADKAAERKEFEMWALDHFFDCTYTNSIDEYYRDNLTERMWLSWQAGRSSLESENAALKANFDAAQKELNVGGQLQIWTSRALAAESENARLREALRRAAVQCWQLKQGFMDIRGATELEPQKEEWIAAKLNQWGVGN